MKKQIKNILLFLPEFHVANSVKLRNLDNTPTLHIKTGVSNQYFMKIEPKQLYHSHF